VWDPQQYARYADERSRPFFELLGRVGATAPAYVVDLGCGDGALTATLLARWPGAVVDGVDSSAQMLAGAEEYAVPGRLAFHRGDLAGWRPPRRPDVVVSNAALQWVPGHEAVLRGLVAGLAPGGWLAVQVPANFDEPSHTLLREVAGRPRWRGAVPPPRPAPVLTPAGYLDLLAGLGCRVDAWQTTYLHVLAGADAVLEWTAGSALRPVLAALSAADAEELRAEYGAALRAAYPERDYGTVFPFRRTFVVATAP
jgi:trans-aconitate 2-methyltransferase